jgi:hypothetical protein
MQIRNLDILHNSYYKYPNWLLINPVNYPDKSDVTCKLASSLAIVIRLPFKL